MGILLCNSREGSSSQSSINMSSRIRQNYHEECEALINKQVNMEMYASYVYLSMASYFNRDDQALHGFAKFFKDNSNEERDHAIMFMDYQSSRGGRVVFQDIAKPTPSEWGTPLEAVEAALELEKTVNQVRMTEYEICTVNFEYITCPISSPSSICMLSPGKRMIHISATSSKTSSLMNR